MKNSWDILVATILVLCICLSVLTACNNLTDQEKEPSIISPSDVVGDENESAGSNQNPVPTGPVKGDENNPTGPSIDPVPTNPTNDNSNIMDGEDHIAVPFG